ncbi:MAG TPA: lysozyme inhibitor LprI family protein [Candidatus Acidoferrales bacterium]|nr:lysozyme inhibitor LprI family protein [Candidatus Acidoferrales bacterium]
MKSTLLVLILLGPGTCFAQNSQRYRTCSDKAATQAAMNACASEEAARADSELNAIYSKLISAAREPGAVEKIGAAERAWIAFRDAYIEAMFPAPDKQAEYGSAYPMNVALLRAKLTKNQALALRELLRQYATSPN